MAVVVEGIGPDGDYGYEEGGGGGGRTEEGKHDSETLDDTAAHADAAAAAAAASGRQSAVDDPMDIVERMVTEFVAHEEETRRRETHFSAANSDPADAADASAGVGAASSASASSSSDGASSSVGASQCGVYSASDEWRCRLAQYLYYVVDEGAFPGALHVRRLLNVITGNMVAPPIISWETANVSSDSTRAKEDNNAS